MDIQWNLLFVAINVILVLTSEICIYFTLKCISLPSLAVLIWIYRYIVPQSPGICGQTFSFYHLRHQICLSVGFYTSLITAPHHNGLTIWVAWKLFIIRNAACIYSIYNIHKGLSILHLPNENGSLFHSCMLHFKGWWFDQPLQNLLEKNQIIINYNVIIPMNTTHFM